MKTVRIGGVPEHFNYAWYIGLKKNAFKAQGIDLRWVDCPGGTGQMTEALKRNSIDMAIVLTEGDANYKDEILNPFEPVLPK